MTYQWTRKLAAFFVRSDPEYDSFVRKHEAKSGKQILFYLSFAFFPGVLAYLLIYPLRPPLMAVTGLSSHYVQFLVLAVMASGWHFLFPPESVKGLRIREPSLSAVTIGAESRGDDSIHLKKTSRNKASLVQSLNGNIGSQSIIPTRSRKCAGMSETMDYVFRSGASFVWH
ncbi:hypothetical protein ABD76_22430, partial [Paenibacillus dendritiformis]|uniref:hypothetical protein n=1 Tax=Paenibacillus dendritiformis TaxID=130049 RepID=UPI0018CD26F5